MTSTYSTTLRRRRLAAAILALPLSLAMTGTAFAGGGGDPKEPKAAKKDTTVSSTGTSGSSAQSSPAPASTAASTEPSAATTKQAKTETKSAPKTETKSAPKTETKSAPKSDSKAASATSPSKPAKKAAAPTSTSTASKPAKSSTSSTGACGASNGIQYDFLYRDGHRDAGVFCGGNNVTKASTPSLHVNSLHISCSDTFVDGAAVKSDLAGHRILSWSIVKPGGKTCSSATTPATGGTSDKASKGSKPSKPSKPSKGSGSGTCDASNGIRYDFVYKDGHRDTGVFCGGNNVTKANTPSLHVNSLHISCSDTFVNGTAVKSDLAGHEIVTWSIVKPGGKTCSSATSQPTAQPCPSAGTMPSKGKGSKGSKGSKGCPDQSDNARDKVTICHATGSTKNPYVLITPSKQGVLSGHVGAGHQGGRDIIPVFTYVENGVTKTFPGQNTTATTITSCPGAATLPATCPDGSAMPSGGRKDCPSTPKGKDKITICHATGSATNPYVVITISTKGLKGHGKHEGDIIPMPAGGCPTAPVTTPDACPNLPGMQLPGASCTPPTTGTGGGGGTVDVCPTVPGMQTMAPCVTNGGGTPGQNPPGNSGGGTPIGGTPGNQPAVNTPPVVGPPTVAPPTILPTGTVQPTVIGTATTPATRAAAARPRTLPFTGTEMALLVELGALLLLAGGGLLLAARRERTARAR